MAVCEQIRILKTGFTILRLFLFFIITIRLKSPGRDRGNDRATTFMKLLAALAHGDGDFQLLPPELGQPGLMVVEFRKQPTFDFDCFGNLAHVGEGLVDQLIQLRPNDKGVHVVVGKRGGRVGSDGGGAVRYRQGLNSFLHKLANGRLAFHFVQKQNLFFVHFCIAEAHFTETEKRNSKLPRNGTCSNEQMPMERDFGCAYVTSATTRFHRDTWPTVSTIPPNQLWTTFTSIGPTAKRVGKQMVKGIGCED
jgi:hypothetical protein